MQKVLAIFTPCAILKVRDKEDRMDQVLDQFGDAISALYEASNALHDGKTKSKVTARLLADAERRIDVATKGEKK